MNTVFLATLSAALPLLLLLTFYGLRRDYQKEQKPWTWHASVACVIFSVACAALIGFTWWGIEVFIEMLVRQ